MNILKLQVSMNRIGAVVDERVLAGADDPSLDAVAVVRRGAGADIAGGDGAISNGQHNAY